LDEAGQCGLAECLLEAIWIVDHIEWPALRSGKAPIQQISAVCWALPLAFAILSTVTLQAFAAIPDPA
jgi:hypothetical protein